MALATLLRILTLNLLHEPDKPTSWPARAPLVEAELLALAPDVVLLQEVAWPDEQASVLASALGRHTGDQYAVWLMEVVVPDRKRPGRLWREALAILSRCPILATEAPATAGAVPVCQHVRLDLGERSVDIYNFHLDPFTPALHRSQLTTILGAIDNHTHPADVVLGGDFNAHPESAAIRLLAARLRSAYAVVHGREREGTVDYLFVSPRLRIAAADLTFTQPAERDPTLYPSDHYGLLAELAWDS
ncbi:MAG: endonuclease/exonuclease/phosphatase family protein [Chloroflexota bacterium]|nr:endonuclease/exonuclease/phosphatase family protein [Chloroflexota bacterium]